MGDVLHPKHNSWFRMVRPSAFWFYSGWLGHSFIYLRLVPSQQCSAVSTSSTFEQGVVKTQIWDHLAESDEVLPPLLSWRLLTLPWLHGIHWLFRSQLLPTRVASVWGSTELPGKHPYRKKYFTYKYLCRFIWRLLSSVSHVGCCLPSCWGDLGQLLVWDRKASCLSVRNSPTLFPTHLVSFLDKASIPVL